MTRQERNTNRALVILCTTLLLLGSGVGCNRPPGGLDNNSAVQDAGVDSATDAAGPRRLSTRGFFGQTPVENRFVDPDFNAIDGVSWNPFNPVNWDLSQVTRAYQMTPMGQVALRLQPPDGAAAGPVAGLAKSAPGPIEVSVWLGRLEGTAVVELDVMLIAMIDGSTSSVDLVADTTGDPLVLDGVSWYRFSARLEEGPAGWVSLRINNKSLTPLFITSPVLVRAQASTKHARRTASATPRPATPIERATLEDFRRRMMNRFGSAEHLLR